MRRVPFVTALSAVPFATALAVALLSCATDDGTNPNPTGFDSGIADTGAIDSGAPETGTTSDAPTESGDTSACALKPFTSPGTSAPAGQILLSASGEVLALGGYAFPPAAAGDPAFVDGWEVTFSRVIVTVDKIRLNANPDKVPTDQSQTDELVAEVDGPWAVDLHKGGPLTGKGGSDEKAVPLAILENQNKKGGTAFDPTARYAFGFDGVVAGCDAMNVNLDADGLKDYQEMIAKGYAVLYVGTATFKGGTTCTSPTTGYDFSKLPKVINFRLGFKTPTTYLNAQNPDNDPATAFAGEEHRRGVQIKTASGIVAQITYHTDHPFWESVVHDSPAHFDMIAAKYIGTDPANAVLEDFKTTDLTNIKDGKGVNLPWRSCVPSYTAKAGTLAFDPQSIPVNPAGTADKALRDLYDFMVYNQSTQGHLNSNGLAFVQRNYPSPK